MADNHGFARITKFVNVKHFIYYNFGLINIFKINIKSCLTVLQVYKVLSNFIKYYQIMACSMQ